MLVSPKPHNHMKFGGNDNWCVVVFWRERNRGWLRPSARSARRRERGTAGAATRPATQAPEAGRNGGGGRISFACYLHSRGNISSFTNLILDEPDLHAGEEDLAVGRAGHHERAIAEGLLHGHRGDDLALAVEDVRLVVSRDSGSHRGHGHQVVTTFAVHVADDLPIFLDMLVAPLFAPEGEKDEEHDQDHHLGQEPGGDRLDEGAGVGLEDAGGRLGDPQNVGEQAVGGGLRRNLDGIELVGSKLVDDGDFRACVAEGVDGLLQVLVGPSSARGSHRDLHRSDRVGVLLGFVLRAGLVGERERVARGQVEEFGLEVSDVSHERVDPLLFRGGLVEGPQGNVPRSQNDHESQDENASPGHARGTARLEKLRLDESEAHAGEEAGGDGHALHRRVRLVDGPHTDDDETADQDRRDDQNDHRDPGPHVVPTHGHELLAEQGHPVHEHLEPDAPREQTGDADQDEQDEGREQRVGEVLGRAIAHEGHVGAGRVAEEAGERAEEEGHHEGRDQREGRHPNHRGNHAVAGVAGVVGGPERSAPDHEEEGHGVADPRHHEHEEPDPVGVSVDGLVAQDGDDEAHEGRDRTGGDLVVHPDLGEDLLQQGDELGHEARSHHDREAGSEHESPGELPVEPDVRDQEEQRDHDAGHARELELVPNHAPPVAGPVALLVQEPLRAGLLALQLGSLLALGRVLVHHRLEPRVQPLDLGGEGLDLAVQPVALIHDLALLALEAADVSVLVADGLVERGDLAISLVEVRRQAGELVVFLSDLGAKRLDLAFEVDPISGCEGATRLCVHGPTIVVDFHLGLQAVWPNRGLLQAGKPCWLKIRVFESCLLTRAGVHTRYSYGP